MWYAIWTYFNYYSFIFDMEESKYGRVLKIGNVVSQNIKNRCLNFTKEKQVEI